MDTEQNYVPATDDELYQTFAREYIENRDYLGICDLFCQPLKVTP